MSKTKAILIGSIVAAGIAAPIVVQQQTNNRLKLELESLRSQLSAAPQPQAPETGSDNLAELDRLRSEHAELLRLRGENTTLRQTA